MEKNNKETKKADFIDLDKSQFKKKPSIFIFLFFGLFVIVIISSYFLKERYQNFSNEINTLKASLERNQTNFENYKKLNLKEEEILKAPKLEESPILEPPINSNRLNDLERELLKMSRIIESGLSMEERDKIKIRVEDVIHKYNQSYYFIIFKKKIMGGKAFEKEINSLKDFFSDNTEIIELLNFFSQISHIRNYQTLYRDLDLIIEGDKYQLTRLTNNEINYQKESESKKFSFSKESLEAYLKNILNSNFKIKKINYEANLRDYIDSDDDGSFDVNNTLKKAKDFLILRDIESAIMEIKSISSPLSDDIEKWVIDARIVKDYNIKLDFLEDKIFEYLIEN
jgi:hypothetical protein